MIYKINEKGEFCKKCFSADEKVKKGIYSIEVKKIGGKGKRGCEWIVSFSFFFLGFLVSPFLWCDWVAGRRASERALNPN